MKVTNIRRKLAAALAAGGLLAPGPSHAADLNTNLLLNPGFEVLTGTDNHIDSWTSGTLVGFTYTYSQNYDNGGPLAGGGVRYFSPNRGTPDKTMPGQVAQDVDVSAGASGALIATGTAAFKLGGFFTSYLTNNDIGHIHVSFLDAGSNSLGTAQVSDNDTSTWTENFIGGLIPVGTATARVSLFATANSGGPDGYMDNVYFEVTDEVILPKLAITVDRETGGIVLSNQTGGPVNLASYVITSAFESLSPANWRSIADFYDAGNPGLEQVDAVHNWSKLTDPATHGDLSEADLESGTGAVLAHGKTINLSNANAWIKTPTEDLVFQYISNGEIVDGVVAFTKNDDEPYVLGDLNTDGSINATDWGILRGNQHKTLSGDSLAEAYRMGDLTGDRLNNHADFVAFKNAYDDANGAGSFLAMVSAVPEPSSLVLLMSAGLFVLPLARRRSNQS